jgi:hypothetical protein
VTTAAFFLNRFEDPIQFYRTFSFTGSLTLVNAVVDPGVYYYTEAKVFVSH